MKGYVSDVLIVVGIASVSGGAWMVYEPAGFIVGGLLVVALGFLLVPLRSSRKSTAEKKG